MAIKQKLDSLNSSISFNQQKINVFQEKLANLVCSKLYEYVIVYI